ncbi:uncharacterized protein LOC115791130 [Archocentrus centrarchus]|uniref:uncharacterized protein LOC115791122 n=1 Tax=Archocentrus centrarchus TaxID=63155 RepID=UPI0011E9FAF8|nr:uncharacterized protein LOC115791122 [Archocentrus centrarchus]XP_030601110.1 uncharacterized protein LOC115791130 [Archocentrus centrarchus]
MNIYLQVVIFAVSLLTISAYPVNSDSRGQTWADAKANQAHDKTDLTKDVQKVYKSNMDISTLYSQEDDDNPVAEEMQRKLTMESERLRIRMRQELAELRERLSPSSAHLSSTLASMRERLTPLTQQLQGSLSSNSQDLCSQLNLYLQALDTAEAQEEASASLYHEAFKWMSQTLEHSSFKFANIIGDFHTSASGAIEHLKQTSEPAASNVWLEISSKLEQEVSSLKDEAQNRAGALKTQLSVVLQSAQPRKEEVSSAVEQFCQNASRQIQVLQARMEKIFAGLEEELVVPRASSLFSSSFILQSGTLREEFSVRLSALIQDIMNSMQ